MAPEVIRPQEGRLGRLGASDVWAMGCVLLEISTGWVAVCHLSQCNLLIQTKGANHGAT